MFKLGSRFLFVIFIAVILASPFAGFAQDNEVEFDNQSGQPALVKLIGPTMKEVNVPINSKLSVTALPGNYHILVRYGTSENYQYTKGEKFEVTETATKKSKTSITLHKVIGGNYAAKPISEKEFTASTIQNSDPLLFTIKGIITNLEKAKKYISEDSYLQLVYLSADGNVGFKTDSQGRKIYNSDLEKINIPSKGDFSFKISSLKPGKYIIAAQLLKALGLRGTPVLAIKKTKQLAFIEIIPSQRPGTIDLGELFIPIP